MEVFRCQGDKVPRLLYCGHTLCHQCLTRLTLHGRALLCPFDRQPTEIGDSGVWGLKKNFALLELLEKLQYSQKIPLKIFSEEALAREKDVSKNMKFYDFYNVSMFVFSANLIQSHSI